MASQLQQVESDLCDIKVIARRLGVSVPCVRYMLDRGDFLPPIRIGRLFRWRRVDVDKWLEDQAEAALESIGGEA